MTGLKEQTEKESFASRWSRRKQQVELEKDDPDTAIDETAGGIVEAKDHDTERHDVQQIRADKLTQLNALKDEDMPDIASLDEESDFSQFMSTSVSEGLRNLALRKLFQGKTYNVRDGLDEYDGDYTSFEKLDPGTITADMKYRQELEAERLREKLEREKAKEIEVTVDDEPEEQVAVDEEHDKADLIEGNNGASPGDPHEQLDVHNEAPLDTDQEISESSTRKTITQTSGENQT